MILSHRKRFLFIKGLKVAGTSIEIALSRLCGERDVITPLLPRDEAVRLRDGRPCQNYGHPEDRRRAYLERVARDYRRVAFPDTPFFNHMSFRQVQERLGASLNDFLYVCAERNPYHKALSLIAYEQTAFAYAMGFPAGCAPDRLRGLVADYVASGRLSRARNIDAYRGPDGRLPDVVLRQETLEEDFQALLRRLGEPPAALPHAKQGILANRLDPLEYFDSDQIGAINTLFAEEFEAFGYPMLRP